MFCPKCGVPNDDDAVFCQGCGYRVEEQKPETDIAPEKTAAAAAAEGGGTSFTLWDVSEDTEMVAGPEDTVVDPVPPPIAPPAAPDQPAGFVTNFENGGQAAPEPQRAAPVPVAPPAPPKKEPDPAKKKNAKKAVALGIIALVIAVGAVVGASIGLQALNRQQSYKDELNLGDRYLNDLDYEKAILAYGSALDIDPGSYQALLGAARANMGAENYTEAKAAFLEAIDNDGKNPDAYSDLAELYIQLDEKDRARSLVDNAVEGQRLQSDDLQRLYSGMHVEDPEFSLPSGSYQERRVVEITDKNRNPIYYTLDGSDPTEENGALYTEPIILRNGVTAIKAIAISAYGFVSRVITAQYAINIPDVEITFTDPGVENAVRRALNKSYYEPVMNDEAASITELTIVGTNTGTTANATFTASEYFWESSNYGSSYLGNVQQLDDLRFLPFLQRFHIAYQENLDIQAISRCKNLSELSLINVNLMDVGPLTGLTRMRKLCLGWNAVYDVRGLSGLTNLTHLGLWGNQIADIGVVSNFPNLIYLDISDNQVKNVSAVSSLAKLRSFWAYGNGITDLSPLVNLNELTTLMIRNNPISGTDDLKRIYPRLTKFDVTVSRGGAGQ